MIAIKGEGFLAEASRDPAYNPPSNGFCQRQSLVSTQVTATVPISMVSPMKQIYLPLVLKNKY